MCLLVASSALQRPHIGPYADCRLLTVSVASPQTPGGTARDKRAEVRHRDLGFGFGCRSYLGSRWEACLKMWLGSALGSSRTKKRRVSRVTFRLSAYFELSVGFYGPESLQGPEQAGRSRCLVERRSWRLEISILEVIIRLDVCSGQGSDCGDQSRRARA